MMLRVALLLGFVSLTWAFGWDTVTPLDEYVARPDPHYRWQFVSKPSSGVDSVDSYVVNMTSQKWKNESVLSRPIWWHYMIINIPKTLQVKDAATLFVGGGHNGDSIPTPDNDQFAALAVNLAKRSGAVTAYLKQIPNQPIVFKNDPLQKSRSEDSLIAYTWRRFIEDPSDPDILLRMPMTKAGVRAMDTVADFCKQKDVTNDINEFLIGGASKRGWTAWTLAAVDKRVIGLVPMVMDLVNMQPNLHHHFRSLGGWTFAFKPYRDENIPMHLDDPNMTKMGDIIDPYSYRERLTMAKMIVCATGDEFFLPDDSHYYFNDLPQPTYMMFCENAEHALLGHHDRIMANIAALFVSIKTGFELPTMTWTRNETETAGTIVLKTSKSPKEIRYWAATTLSDGRRDFRLVVKAFPYIHPVIWGDGPVEDLGNNVYRVELNKVPGDWVGFYIAATFDGPDGKKLELTTEMHIIPDTFPFPPCHGAACKGTLV